MRIAEPAWAILFLLTPLREGRLRRLHFLALLHNFYSRPCGRGDRVQTVFISKLENFYSRPCGRGDKPRCVRGGWDVLFLLTPLREGRHQRR